MKIILDLAANGIISTTVYSDEEPNLVTVFEMEDDMGNESFEGRAAVLWHLIDQLGWYGSKHNPKRLRVNIESNEEAANV